MHIKLHSLYSKVATEGQSEHVHVGGPAFVGSLGRCGQLGLTTALATVVSPSLMLAAQSANEIPRTAQHAGSHVPAVSWYRWPAKLISCNGSQASGQAMHLASLRFYLFLYQQPCPPLPPSVSLQPCSPLGYMELPDGTAHKNWIVIWTSKQDESQQRVCNSCKRWLILKRMRTIN